MTVHLVTFASDEMSKSAELCVESAMRHGVQCSTQEGPIPASPELAERGCGFWKWKPRIILDAMSRTHKIAPVGLCEFAAKAYTNSAVRDGDILIYADAGVEFIEPVQTIIDLMDQDIFLFGNEHQHAHWCKRDVIEAVWPDNKLYSDENNAPVAVDTWRRFGKQVQASIIFFRMNDHTRAFVKEWLDWCLFDDGRLIDDSPSRTPNHSEFKENRHDQAILTTMAYREGIKLHEWFVKYEGYTPGRMNGYPRELERPFVFHHRRRNADWMVAA